MAFFIICGQRSEDGLQHCVVHTGHLANGEKHTEPHEYVDTKVSVALRDLVDLEWSNSIEIDYDSWHSSCPVCNGLEITTICGPWCDKKSYTHGHHKTCWLKEKLNKHDEKK